MGGESLSGVGNTFNFTGTPSYTLTVQISKDDTADATATITINVTETVTEVIAPLTIAGATFSIIENNAAGVEVGTVATTGNPTALSITATDSIIAENSSFTSTAPTLAGDDRVGEVTYALTGTDAGLFDIKVV